MEKNFARILCPTDFTPASAYALEEAAKLVSIFKAKLFVTHIITNPWSDIYGEKVDKAMSPEEAARSIEGIVKDFVEKHATGVSYDILVKNHEHIYSGIIDYAEERDADLIVMATSGRTGAKRILLGSVAESVVRRAPCSVLVVR